MYKLRRKLFSQNFLHRRALVEQLVRYSSLGKNDLVLEIGPGKGIITEQLIKQTQHVLAVEIDTHWYSYLKTKFANNKNLTLFQGDFLDSRLPSLPYKVFANIPFAIEGKIIRKLINAKNPPEDCYLITMKELAYRLSAPYKENLFSLMHKPWFEFSIYHHFNRTDFTPVPSVEVVMMRFTKRKAPLLPWNERKQFEQFIQVGFGQGLPVFRNLKCKFGHKRVIDAFMKIGINKNTKPSFVTLKQWLHLYHLLNLSKYNKLNNIALNQ